MAPHSSTLAWKIPWTEELGGLQFMGSLGVRHDWAISLGLFTFMHWRKKWQPTPVFLPGEPQGQRSLADDTLGAHKESDTTERFSLTLWDPKERQPKKKNVSIFEVKPPENWSPVSVFILWSSNSTWSQPWHFIPSQWGNEIAFTLTIQAVFLPWVQCFQYKESRISLIVSLQCFLF